MRALSMFNVCEEDLYFCTYAHTEDYVGFNSRELSTKPEIIDSSPAVAILPFASLPLLCLFCVLILLVNLCNRTRIIYDIKNGGDHRPTILIQLCSCYIILCMMSYRLSNVI